VLNWQKLVFSLIRSRFQSYVQYGSPKLFIRKSDSERALASSDRVNSDSKPGSTLSLNKKANGGGDRSTMKRSITMASIPINTEKVDSNLIR
jgi:hypothetical protein